MIKKVLKITRVKWSKDSTPFDLREYKILGTGLNSPCGTINEFLEWANKKDYSQVIAFDGEKSYQYWTKEALK